MKNENIQRLHGAGLGLRRAHMGPLTDPAGRADQILNFLEVAPENWMGIGGALGKQFRHFTERYPFVLHGLSLNLGGHVALDEPFLHQLKKFMQQHNINGYSEHLSYSADSGHLYDLMPIPFTEEAVEHVAARIRQTQDILQQKIAIENISYYAAPGQQMPEIEFINAVIERADCNLLLDVNNIYVNSINHHYDAREFLQQIPGDRISYIHIAGHYVEDTDLVIDTHGAPVVDTVWELLHTTYELFGVKPTLLERD
ncbi:MAG: DUF692 domain-containing protein, partial [Gammaproteobacteria bacterium]|nr:DUF692 domain-containing protein [Gammaproteobacteria bacterium]